MSMPSTPRTTHARVRSLLPWLAVIALAGGAALWWSLFGDLPRVRTLEEHVVRPTTRIEDRNGQLLYEVLDPSAGKQFDLSLDDLPNACIQATLATEDKRFYSHPGVDVVAIGRALYQNFRARGDIVSGGSTITQQVARGLLLPAEERYTQSVRRKLREAWLALFIELRYTKDEILALYLNQTYYGNFAFGMEAASQVFFAKPARQLARSECALLAGLVQYPTGYNPLAEPETARARQLTVLRLMREAGFIDEDEQAAIAAEPLQYKSQLFNIAAPHFVMRVQDQVLRRLGADRLREGGLTIRTTLDLNLQRQAEAAVRHRLDLLNCRLPGICTPITDPNRRVDNAAVVVLDSHSGDILALVGSPDYFDEAIQGNVDATQTLRQPGSAIKPLTYAAALDRTWSTNLGLQPLTPASILADLPTVFYATDETGARVPYSPVNYDRRAHGPVSVREALANSYNIPAVKVLERVGVETLKRLASEAGISTFNRDYGLALTLGGGEVRLLDLTASFGILDDGRRLDPRAILAIDDDKAPQPGQGARVIETATAWLLTDILDDDVARMPAFGGASVLDLPFQAAAKTGTTTDWRDNWTIGYSTERLVGVWVGNADNAPMLDVSGIDGAGPIWRDVMLAAHTTPPAPFARPQGIVDATICATSGLLASPDCPRSRVEHFLAGTEPTRADDHYQRIAIDRATGLRADASTPPDRTESRLYWALPPEYHDWMVGQGIATAPPVAAPTASAASAASQPSAQAGAQVHAQGGDLVLVEPASNTAYQIHPGVPRSQQRLEVIGYTGDATLWDALRIVRVDDSGARIVVEARESARVRGWWPLEAGVWRFRLEGRRHAQSQWESTGEALVRVEAFISTTLVP